MQPINQHSNSWKLPKSRLCKPRRYTTLGATAEWVVELLWSAFQDNLPIQTSQSRFRGRNQKPVLKMGTRDQIWRPPVHVPKFQLAKLDAKYWYFSILLDSWSMLSHRELSRETWVSRMWWLSGAHSKYWVNSRRTARSPLSEGLPSCLNLASPIRSYYIP